MNVDEMNAYTGGQYVGDNIARATFYLFRCFVPHSETVTLAGTVQAILSNPRDPQNHTIRVEFVVPLVDLLRTAVELSEQSQRLSGVGPPSDGDGNDRNDGGGGDDGRDNNGS